MTKLNKPILYALLGAFLPFAVFTIYNNLKDEKNYVAVNVYTQSTVSPICAKAEVSPCGLNLSMCQNNLKVVCLHDVLLIEVE